MSKKEYKISQEAELRVIGTKEEIDEFISWIESTYRIIDISPKYPFRDNPDKLRTYLTIAKNPNKSYWD